MIIMWNIWKQREAIEFYELIKCRMDEIYTRESINNGQILTNLNLFGLPKADDEANFRNFKNFDILEFPPFDNHFLRLKNGAKLFCGSLNRSLRERIVKSGRY